MRAGGCTVQQALTPEAAGVVKQAVNLARRRGHAQVTPLHVANTMLSSPTGLLRTACLQSHSHPLQCKALELCFNVALNRLPASTSSPMLPPHSQQFPCISNALVAAFKRAQAHQRRGSIETQQQPLLAVKIELEQLIISILDDPSVSRVMREAGFSSTQVKSNVEQAVSLEICSSASNSKDTHIDKPTPSPSPSSPPSDSDVMYVIDNLTTMVMNKRRRSSNLVVVGECVVSVESVVKRVMERVNKGEGGEGLRDVKFVSVSLSSFLGRGRLEIEHKVEEIRRGGCCGGVVFYLGDIEWACSSGNSSGNGGYMEHMVMEIGKLLCGEKRRFWLMGIATFQTYMRCKSGRPSLESLWTLQPLTIPAGSLRLSLITDNSDVHSQSTSKGGGELTCCVDCSSKFEAEARNLQSSSSVVNSESSTSTLPAWLQQYKDQNKPNDKDSMRELCEKWNSICKSIHKQQPHYYERSLRTSSTCNLSHPTTITKNFWSDQIQNQSNPNSTSSEEMEMEMETETETETEATNNFKELNASNMTKLCKELQNKVPWQKDIIPEIATTVLKCRSGMVKRRFSESNIKEDTWLFFQGVDVKAKEKISKELSRLIFKTTNFVSIALSSFSSDSTEGNKRTRSDQSCSYIHRFAEALTINPHRVFLIEDVEQADYCSQKGFKRAMERGSVVSSNGDEVGLSDAIIILSCESFSSRSRACSPPKMDDNDDTTSPVVSLDLNISIDDDNEDELSIDDIGLVESVDKRVLFKLVDL